MEQEDVMRFNDAKRKSFNNGWKAAAKATVEWLSAQKELVGISFEKDFYERYKQFMKDGKI